MPCTNKPYRYNDGSWTSTAVSKLFFLQRYDHTLVILFVAKIEFANYIVQLQDLSLYLCGYVDVHNSDVMHHVCGCMCV